MDTKQPPAIVYPIPPAGSKCVIVGADYSLPPFLGTFDEKGRCVFPYDPRYFRPAGTPENVK